MLLPSMTSKRIACGPPFHNFTFYSIPQNRADGGGFAQKKPLPLGEVSPKVTERVSQLPNSCCTAMSRAFDRAVLSLCLGVSVSSLALSGACAPALPEGEPFAAVYSTLIALTGQALAASTASGTWSGGMSPGMATARVPSIWYTSGQSPAHWVQPMQSSGSTNAFMLVLPPFKMRKRR